MTLKSEVIKDLQEEDDKQGYLQDVLRGGVGSGIVNRLIWTIDAVKFFNRNETEIEDMIKEFQEDFGYEKRSQFISSIDKDGFCSIEQEKVLLSWFAYEETVRTLLDAVAAGEEKL